MKKFILAMLCAGTVVSANAQENSVLLFGNFGGTMITKTDPGVKDVTNSFNIMPGIGYQLCHSWTVGIEGTFNYNANSTTTGSVTSKTSGMGVGGGVFGRYTCYINPMLYFYTQADAVYSTMNSYANDKLIAGSTSNNFYLRFSPVIGINIRNGYGLNFGFGGIGYDYNNVSSAKSTTSAITYNFGQAFSIGVSKNFLHHVIVVRTEEDKAAEVE